MTTELTYLSASIGLYFLMVAIQAVFSNLEHTPKDLLGPRDSVTDASVMTLRAKRALANMNEAMLMFAPLVLIVVVSEQSTTMTALGASLFFWGRTVFAPMYYFGVPVIRTLAWTVALIGTAMVARPLLPF